MYLYDGLLAVKMSKEACKEPQINHRIITWNKNVRHRRTESDSIKVRKYAKLKNILFGNILKTKIQGRSYCR